MSTLTVIKNDEQNAAAERRAELCHIHTEGSDPTRALCGAAIHPDEPDCCDNNPCCGRAHCKVCDDLWGGFSDFIENDGGEAA